VFWVIAGIVLLGLEMWKTGLFNASLGFGALAASGVSVLFPGNPMGEVITFVAVSFLLFHFVRPRVKKSLDQENFLPGPDTLRGVHGVLLDQVVENKLGMAEVNGDVWSCTGEAGQMGNAGDKVVVIGHIGSVLTVRIIE